MRLDHLLSRERIQREIGGFIPGRCKQKVKASKFVDQRKLIKSRKRQRNPRSQEQSGRIESHLLEPVSFSGIAKARTECTLKTAQPDGKHLVKKPVANVFKRTHERRNANNFAVGLRRKETIKD